MMGDIRAVGKGNSAVQAPHPRKARTYHTVFILVPSVPLNVIGRHSGREHRHEQATPQNRMSALFARTAVNFSKRLVFNDWHFGTWRSNSSESIRINRGKKKTL
jgi:hypothetical protein